MLVSLAYQTHGEGWRLGAGADVDLHIQRQASGGGMLGVCMCVFVCVNWEKNNALHESDCMRQRVGQRRNEMKDKASAEICCQQCHVANYGHPTLKIKYINK